MPNPRPTRLLALLPLSLALAACGPMSALASDPAAGWNGGFERTRDGLPLNWNVYAPSTVPSGVFTIDFDPLDPPEGRQSLCFRIEEASAGGGRESPGIFREFPATPGGRYSVAFWIRSEGCAWSVTTRAVDAKTGAGGPIAGTADAGPAWTRIERTVRVPPEYDRLRFELSIRSPGTLWIDDVVVTPLAAAPSGG